MKRKTVNGKEGETDLLQQLGAASVFIVICAYHDTILGRFIERRKIKIRFARYVTRQPTFKISHTTQQRGWEDT